MCRRSTHRPRDRAPGGHRARVAVGPGAQNERHEPGRALWNHPLGGVRAVGGAGQRQCGAARRGHSGGSRLRPADAEHPHPRVLRGVADAHRARAGALPVPGSAAAGRADQSPGRARADLAGGVPADVGEDRGDCVPRPRLPQLGDHVHHLHPPQADVVLRRQLRHLPEGARGAPSQSDGDGEGAGRARGAPQAVHRQVRAGAQEDGEAGAEPAEDARAPAGRAGGGGLRRPLPEARLSLRHEAAPPLHLRAGRRLRLQGGPHPLPESGLWAGHGLARGHRGPQRRGQVHLPAPPHGQDHPHRRLGQPPHQAAPRHVQSAPHRDDGR
mmetsp:Transcript_20851/g.45692  ORF Transcript_20851/g.45692 Transcript_20851/m.45692 type:complete len:327 (-) Transcript_20851:1088-2068(-)